MAKIQLGSHLASSKGDPYIIAEIGMNHEGDLELAKKQIELAKKGGAHGAKFQSYQVKKLYTKRFFSSTSTKNKKDSIYTGTKNDLEYLEKISCFQKNDYEKLATHCKTMSIDFLSTPFDMEAVHFLEPLVPFYKISSGDINHKVLLEEIAKQKKPVLLSTGGANLSEIEDAIKTLKEHGSQLIVILHCILSYPCQNEDANLGMIHSLKKSFPNCLLGYSDHTTTDNSMSLLNIALGMGICVIEKHFTHDKSLAQNDHPHSMDINDLKKLTENIKLFQKIYGKEHKTAIPIEKKILVQARRSLVLRYPLKKGAIIKAEDIDFKRPGDGISPIFLEEVLGKKLILELEGDDVLRWSHLEIT